MIKDVSVLSWIMQMEAIYILKLRNKEKLVKFAIRRTKFLIGLFKWR